jgi:hypothetical protein
VRSASARVRTGRERESEKAYQVAAADELLLESVQEMHILVLALALVDELGGVLDLLQRLLQHIVALVRLGRLAQQILYVAPTHQR